MLLSVESTYCRKNIYIITWMHQSDKVSWFKCILVQFIIIIMNCTYSIWTTSSHSYCTTLIWTTIKKNWTTIIPFLNYTKGFFELPKNFFELLYINVWTAKVFLLNYASVYLNYSCIFWTTQKNIWITIMVILNHPIGLFELSKNYFCTTKLYFLN